MDPKRESIFNTMVSKTYQCSPRIRELLLTKEVAKISKYYHYMDELVTIRKQDITSRIGCYGGTVYLVDHYIHSASQYMFSPEVSKFSDFRSFCRVCILRSNLPTRFILSDKESSSTEHRRRQDGRRLEHTESTSARARDVVQQSKQLVKRQSRAVKKSLFQDVLVPFLTQPKNPSING